MNKRNVGCNQHGLAKYFFIGLYVHKELRLTSSLLLFVIVQFILAYYYCFVWFEWCLIVFARCLYLSSNFSPVYTCVHWEISNNPIAKTLPLVFQINYCWYDVACVCVESNWFCLHVLLVIWRIQFENQKIQLTMYQPSSSPF